MRYVGSLFLPSTQPAMIDPQPGKLGRRPGTVVRRAAQRIAKGI
jgi:hypothetical protein